MPACLVLVSVVTLVVAIVVFLIPIGVVGDSDCGLPIEAATRPEFNSVCNPPGRDRLAIVALFALASVLAATGWYRTHTRERGPHAHRRATGAEDPAVGHLVGTTNRLIGLGVLGLVAAVLAIVTFAVGAAVVDDARHFETADQCDVPTFVDQYGASDVNPPDSVRFVGRRWLPPEIHCEVLFHSAPVAGPVTYKFRVTNKYWNAFPAFALSACLLTLALFEIRKLWTQNRRTLRPTTELPI